MSSTGWFISTLFACGLWLMSEIDKKYIKKEHEENIREQVLEDADYTEEVRKGLQKVIRFQEKKMIEMQQKINGLKETIEKNEKDIETQIKLRERAALKLKGAMKALDIYRENVCSECLAKVMKAIDNAKVAEGE